MQAVCFEDNEVTKVKTVDLEEKPVYISSSVIKDILIPYMYETPTGDPKPEVDPQFNKEPHPNEDPHHDEDSQSNDDPQRDANPQPSYVRNVQTNWHVRRSQWDRKRPSQLTFSLS
jgi:hypothetical protein